MRDFPDPLETEFETLVLSPGVSIHGLFQLQRLPTSTTWVYVSEDGSLVPFERVLRAKAKSKSP